MRKQPWISGNAFIFVKTKGLHNPISPCAKKIVSLKASLKPNSSVVNKELVILFIRVLNDDLETCCFFSKRVMSDILNLKIFQQSFQNPTTLELGCISLYSYKIKFIKTILNEIQKEQYLRFQLTEIDNLHTVSFSFF